MTLPQGMCHQPVSVKNFPERKKDEQTEVHCSDQESKAVLHFLENVYREPVVLLSINIGECLIQTSLHVVCQTQELLLNKNSKNKKNTLT